MAGVKGRGNQGHYKSWCDGPRPKYCGPAWIGKAIKAPPIEAGPGWIGKRIPFGSIGRDRYLKVPKRTRGGKTEPGK